MKLGGRLVERQLDQDHVEPFFMRRNQIGCGPIHRVSALFLSRDRVAVPLTIWQECRWQPARRWMSPSRSTSRAAGPFHVRLGERPFAPAEAAQDRPIPDLFTAERAFPYPVPV